MSTPPKTYRLYSFDAARKIVSADWLEAADDSDAMVKATAAGFGSKCEIWDGSRMVAQIDERRHA